MQKAMRLAIVAAIAMCLASLPGLAAREDKSTNTTTTGLELVVFERRPCTYCEIFRREILPRYVSAPTARTVPMRFVDIDHVDIESLGLRTQLTLLPTIVLMQKGAEVERIAGYTGPETFFPLVQALMNRAK